MSVVRAHSYMDMAEQDDCSWERSSRQLPVYSVGIYAVLLGESDRGPTQRLLASAENCISFENSGISGPYCSVGNGRGLNVRLFASEHPEEILFMVSSSVSRRRRRPHRGLMPQDEREISAAEVGVTTRS